MSDAEKAVRTRLFNDFEFYAKHCVRIRTKDGKIEPLVLNRVQRRFVAVIERQLRTKGYVRIVTLKARQQGLSTIIHAWLYWYATQRPGAKKIVVVAHKADSTRALFDMYKRTHAHCPEMVRPSTQYSSRKELVFDKLDTGLLVATAGGDGIARGETITHAHRSEVAFWPTSSAAENMNALDQAIPATPGTADFIESTANGYNEFYEIWKGATEGINGYEPFFSPWFETPEYREDAPADFERTFEENDTAELALREWQIILDNAQLQWRRTKIAKNGRELFMQEYPATPEEAFIASGRPVFDPEQITPLHQSAPSPVARMAVESDGIVREHSRGELQVYRTHEPSQTYTIGADIGMGVRNGDPSVAQVLDGDKRQVAVWRGLIHPDAFADVLKGLGLYYNTALIAPERNNHGLLTCVRLWKDLKYPNVFLDVTEGQIADRDSINVGFLTNERTKPLIIDRLRAAVRDSEIKIYDRATLDEMQTFIVTESGKMEAEQGKHDDTVIALAICNHVHQRNWKPVQVTDDYYFAAI